MVLKLFITIFFSFVVAFNACAHDSERIEQLERELQEIKERLSVLEALLLQENEATETEGTSDGWKSLANWRRLKTGMNPGTVQTILGEPQRIRSGNLTIWQYENRGRVIFVEGKVESWSEPY